MFIKNEIIFGYFVWAIFSLPLFSWAENIEELKSKIDNRNLDIQNLELEIKRHQNQLDAIGKDKKTLNNDIKSLDISKQKIIADISLTQKKILIANSDINKLNDEIKDKEEKINTNKEVISKIIREIDQNENQSLVETILSEKNLSEFLDETKNLKKLQESIGKFVDKLKILKEDSLSNKKKNEEKKKELIGYKSSLSDKTKIIESNKIEKNTLLAMTKNRESNYKKILDEKIALKEAFEAELADFESQLQMQIDPNSIPAGVNSLLSWPLKTIKITQYFGNTLFASQHAQVYNGGGHNGVDFGASVGTEIKASLGGVVEGVGDTDVACKGASYGKWVLIKHNNGLSTLYAHLSLIKVSPGETVTTGEIIGYSGNTGYSTGPHLHFTVYASQGVKIDQYSFKSCKGKSVLMPLADKKAYLNPFSYLPKI